MKKDNICHCWSSSTSWGQNEVSNSISVHSEDICKGNMRTANHLIGDSMKYYYDVNDCREYFYTFGDEEYKAKKLFSDQVIMNGCSVRKRLKRLKKKHPNEYKDIISILFDDMEFKLDKHFKKADVKAWNKNS